jgi:Tfp pilus assembly protein PilX
MTRRRQRGTTLVVGFILLSLVTLLGLAGASSAHLERVLATHEQFRENAATAASAGLEFAISRIVTSSTPDAVTASSTGLMPGAADRFEIVTRFAGYELALPQAPGAGLAGAHFEITSTGHSARRAIDRQRAEVMWVVDAPSAVDALICEPDAAVRCYQRGELVRLSWQRLPPD